MSRRLCSAGVAGPCSYVILNNSNSVTVHLHDEDSSIVETHIDMDIAEKRVEQYVYAQLKRKYETD